MNLDKYDDKYQLEENAFVQKIPRLEKFLGLFDLYVSVWRCTFIIGVIWGITVAAAFIPCGYFTGTILLCFWIFGILIPLIGVLWGFKKNKRSFIFPPLAVLLFDMIIAVIFAIMELLDGNSIV